MNQRGVTNVLLAIIAGVLLFGQSAMVGALKWAALGIAALIAVFVVVRLLAWIVSGGVEAVREVMDEWRSDAPVQQKLASAGGLVMIPFMIWFGLTWLWLWYSDTPDLKRAVFDTAAGKAWMVVLLAFIGGAAILLATKGALWLHVHQSELPARLRTGLLYWVIGIFAVVAFPINEWRHRRAEGSGIAGLILAPAGMVIVGAMVSSVCVMLTTIVIAAVLAWSGVTT